MKLIQIVSGIIGFFFGIFAVVFVEILPLIGIYFDFNTRGASMEPTLINAVDIRLGPKWAPFEELQMGDIIVFKQKDYMENDGPPGMAYIPEWNKDHTKLNLVPETEPEEESLKYIRVLHRVIDIKENGLVTKGDNNEYPDFVLVKSDDYEGKIVWHMNHISGLFKLMYKYGLCAGCIILYFAMSFCLWNKKASNLSPNNRKNEPVFRNGNKKRINE